MSTEPTRIIGYLTTAIGTIITLLIAFGADISDEQRNALLAAVGSVVPVVVIMIEVIRSRVISPSSAGEAVALAKQEGAASPSIPEIKVAGFKEAVVETLKENPDANSAGLREHMIKWRPKMAPN